MPVLSIHMQNECQLSSKSEEIKDLRNCSSITFKNVSDFNLTHGIDISQNNGFVMIGDESGTSYGVQTLLV